MFVLATTFDPRGEGPRLQRAYPLLQSVYDAVIISLPPKLSTEDQQTLNALPAVHLVLNTDWAEGRYSALKAALALQPTYVHYVDMDRLLRWVETRPQEWRKAAEAVKAADYLLFGRSEQ